MHLIIHESAHLLLSLTVAFFVWKKFKKPLYTIAGALAGGVFVDVDHLFDYVLAFGTKLNLSYIAKGYVFLKTDKIYVLFHAWEWVLLLLIVVKFSKSQKTKSILLAFSLALFFHLTVDLFVNHLTIPGYSIIYRIKNNFELKKLVTGTHYKNHIQEKAKTRYTY